MFHANPPSSMRQPVWIADRCGRAPKSLPAPKMVIAVFPASAVDFVHEVMPILKEHCSECHTGKKKKGGLAMNTRAQLLAGGENGKVVIPGNAAKSLFMELIHSTDDDEYMSPVQQGRAHPVDRLLDAGLLKDKLPTPARIDDAAFLRRAYLDVHGLLPTPAALDAFVADSAIDKRE